MRAKQGFSLVEAMVVVTIIGIIVVLGRSRFNSYIARARQAEAKTNLTHLVSLQHAYLVEHKKYSYLPKVGLAGANTYECGTSTPGEGMLNELGFRPKDCTELRYQYWMPLGRLALIEQTPPLFVLRADSNPAVTGVYIWPDCDSRDMWRVTQGGNVKQPGNHEFGNTGRQRRALENCE